ncbi:MAG: HU family DNA-binding protein [Candidatus Doudnabacteria bacterium]
MTKAQTMQALAEKTGMTKKQVEEFFEIMVEMLYQETKTNGEFTIPGVGKMKKKHRNARMGRNPATGESIQIPAKTVLKFTVAKAAKDNIL